MLYIYTNIRKMCCYVCMCIYIYYKMFLQKIKILKIFYWNVFVTKMYNYVMFNIMYKYNVCVRVKIFLNIYMYIWIHVHFLWHLNIHSKQWTLKICEDTTHSPELIYRTSQWQRNHPVKNVIFLDSTNGPFNVNPQTSNVVCVCELPMAELSTWAKKRWDY